MEEGPVMGEPVPRLLSMPPQDSVAQVVGFSKGKAAIHTLRTVAEPEHRHLHAGRAVWGLWGIVAGWASQGLRATAGVGAAAGTARGHGASGRVQALSAVGAAHPGRLRPRGDQPVHDGPPLKAQAIYGNQ